VNVHVSIHVIVVSSHVIVHIGSQTIIHVGPCRQARHRLRSQPR
jgi:hypothetical protein